MQDTELMAVADRGRNLNTADLRGDRGRFLLPQADAIPFEGEDVDLRIDRVEEAEVPLEQLHEHVHETAEHSSEKWISWVALTTAVLAVLAAIGALFSGKCANEAMLNQITASDQWNYYQAKSIKAAVLDAKLALATTPNGSDRAKLKRYESEQEEIKSEAEGKQVEAQASFRRHEVYARGVMMFQIAIAVAAISALTRKRHFWFVSIAFGVVGCVFLAVGTFQH